MKRSTHHNASFKFACFILSALTVSCAEQPSGYIFTIKHRDKVNVARQAADFISEMKSKGIGLQYLNIGGGLGIVYDKEAPQTAQNFARRVLPILRKTGLKVILEPGRFIVGNAGILVSKVLYVKATAKKKFAIVDAGMNDLIRPSLYGAYHNILPLTDSGRRMTTKYDIVGPICESGDFLAKDRLMPEVREGDYLAVMSAGAYGFSMASNYNSRRRAREVMVVKDRVFTIRKRETNQDLVRNEEVPAFLSGI